MTCDRCGKTVACVLMGGGVGGENICLSCVEQADDTCPDADQWCSEKNVLNARILELAAEVKVTDELLADAMRVVHAIPGCSAHGAACVPHAIEWIKRRVNLDKGPPACADEIAELEKLLMVYGDAHFACGEHPDDAPIDEYDVLVEKSRDAKRAIIEWVEKREAKIVELEGMRREAIEDAMDARA